MSKPAFSRDGILSPAERVASARKCLDLLLPEIESMGDTEAQFVTEMGNKINRWGVTERQLMWLRDLCSTYAQ